MCIVITGGAGFIGSCIVRTLNESGFENLIIVDHIGDTNKWKNLVGKQFRAYYDKTVFLRHLAELQDVTAVIHMGACSSTVETDYDYLWLNNVMYTKTLWQWCIDINARFIYASSAATYGNGEMGFSDCCNLRMLKPLNDYALSKHAFDLWVDQQKIVPKQHVGLKFFNVYGPNEYHKGQMASMVMRGFHQIERDGVIKLFESNNSDYSNGEQARDFIYVKDVCKIVLWLLSNPDVSGLFNVGTGIARSFQDLAEQVFLAIGLEPKIDYVKMPDAIKKQYQNYTKADIGLLRSVGYSEEFYSLEDGVHDYINNYLLKDSLSY